MNFNDKFCELRAELKTAKDNIVLLEKQIDNTETELTECLAFTDKFLKLCSKHKIKEVCIRVENEIVNESVGFVFGTHQSIFANSNDLTRVLEEMGIWGGCSNYHQAQINDIGISKLVDGAYQFKDGKWNKID